MSAQIGKLFGAALAGSGLTMVYMQLTAAPPPEVEAAMPADVKVREMRKHIKPCSSSSKKMRHTPIYTQRDDTLGCSHGPLLLLLCFLRFLAELAAQEDSLERRTVPCPGCGQGGCSPQDAGDGQHGGLLLGRVGRGAHQGRWRCDVSSRRVSTRA